MRELHNAVVTLSISHPNNDCWIREGLLSKREYARRIGADFINITEPKLDGSVPMEKYQIGNLRQYNRILYLDADLFIRPDAPNLFDEVPADCFGIYDEGRPALLAWLREGWPDCPCQFYTNNGLFVCSYEHRWLFDYRTLNRKLNTYEQTHMVYRLWKALEAKPPQIKVHWLSQSWNYMPHLWINEPPRGWVHNVVPDPIYVWHYPCHGPEERAAALKELNGRYNLKS